MKERIIMPVAKIGDRVGAILSASKTHVYLLGFGVYEGDFVPDASDSIATAIREMGWKNPRLRLDDGRVVWGCECWWGPEERVRREMEGRTVVRVDLDGNPLPESA